MLGLEKCPVIAAVHSKDDFTKALQSGVNIILVLHANVMTLKNMADASRAVGKSLLVHADMTEGIAKDEYGIAYIAENGATGIVSTRGGLIKYAKKENLRTIQRFFAIDAHSVKTAVESIKSFKPDMIEIMPGIIPKIIPKFREYVQTPIIMGGLIETRDEVVEALKSGASAISTSATGLWK